MSPIFNPKQQEYLQNATHRWNVKTGATASGKTYLDYAYVIPRRLLTCHDVGLKFLIGNTRQSLEQNILSPMRDIWGEEMVGNISQATGKVQLFGQTVNTIGADNKSQVSKIQGATIEYAYGDEITTWSRDVFEMLKSRLRTKYSKFDGTCNPAGPKHWFKEFLDQPGLDVYHQAYNLDDNPALPEDVVYNIKAEYFGTVYYDRYVLGKWALAEGLVYPEFDKAVVERESRVYDQYQIAIDYGIHNPTVYLLFGFSQGRWYLVDEYYHSGRETMRPKTDQQYYDDLVAFADNRPIKKVIIDPSASSFITLIQQRGLFHVRLADNNVLDGIRDTASVLNAGLIQIDDTNHKTIEEAGLYSWDSRVGEDKVLKDFDHCMDAMRYFVRTNRLARVLKTWQRGAPINEAA